MKKVCSVCQGRGHQKVTMAKRIQFPKCEKCNGTGFCLQITHEKVRRRRFEPEVIYLRPRSQPETD